MIGRVLLCLLLAFCFTDARVDFNHSSIYDEFDFKGQANVVINSLCKDSCHIYASITPESRKFASNILIQTAKAFTSVSDIADRIDATTKRKSYLEVTNTASLSIANLNSNLDAGPLVLYVVNQAGSYFTSAEIYEAEGFLRPQSGLLGTLTVMSARPFTLKQDRDKGGVADAPQGVLAQMAGFDALGYMTDPCPYLYYLLYAPFPGFTMEVNGPIISLLYDLNQFHFPAGDLSATIGITNKRQLERAGWVGSPGFHGCLNKQPYRSSLYDYTSPVYAEVTSAQAEILSVDVVTNSDTAHAVVLNDADSGYSVSACCTSDSTPINFPVNTKNLTINWTPDGSGATHFLVRYNSTTLVPQA